MIMKGCMQWNPVYDWKNSCLQGVSNSELIDEQARALLSYLGSRISYVTLNFLLQMLEMDSLIGIRCP